MLNDPAYLWPTRASGHTDYTAQLECQVPVRIDLTVTFHHCEVTINDCESNLQPL